MTKTPITDNYTAPYKNIQIQIQIVAGTQHSSTNKSGIKMKKYLFLSVILLSGCQTMTKLEHTNSYELCERRSTSSFKKTEIDNELRKRGIDPLSMECGAAAAGSSTNASGPSLQEMRMNSERSRQRLEQDRQRLSDRVEANKRANEANRPVKTVCRNSYGKVQCVSRKHY